MAFTDRLHNRGSISTGFNLLSAYVSIESKSDADIFSYIFLVSVPCADLGTLTYWFPLFIFLRSLLKRFIALLCFFFSIYSQKKQTDNFDESSLYSGLKFRNIGPAFMSGRIADIAINPSNENEWYVAVGSGGAWKSRSF